MKSREKLEKVGESAISPREWAIPKARSLLNKLRMLHEPANRNKLNIFIFKLKN
jgi:hypothetical protein